MARLVSPPVGLRANKWRPLSGPRTVGSGSSESIEGFTQTFGSPFGGVDIEYSFPPIRGHLARRTRGWIKSLHGGANATRWSVCDWDGLSFAQRGIVTSSAEWKQGQPWSNDQPWSNGENWASSNPTVAVAAAAARDATIVSLADAFWGHNLGIGDWIGFLPFHFGWYEVTEVIEPGTYRIDLPLRKALTTADFATLNPTLVMKLKGENSAQAERGPAFLDGLTIALTEVRDYDVRDWFTD